MKDGKAEDATRQPEQVRAFRDTWKLGIHSYLAYLRDRLLVARSLLTETGSIFVQIGDENVHLVRNVLDEVFGRSNFSGQISFTKTSGSTASTIPSVSDYLLWYAKNAEDVKYRKLFVSTAPGSAGAVEYKRVELADGTNAPISQFISDKQLVLPADARIFATDSIVSAGGDDPDIDLEWNGTSFRLSCKPNRHWKPGVDGIKRLWSVGRLLRQQGLRIYKRYFDDFPYRELVKNWTDTRGEDDSVYVVQTNTKVIERCLLMTTDPGDLILDPTCGSGTSAFVAEQWGRRWITCDTSRVALALARTRLMAAKYPYYLLADSSEGNRKEAELTGKLAPDYLIEGDVSKGFVYKRVPHVMLKSIANSPDIVEGMTREQLDAAIARHADSETLFDQPYEDNKRVRVCGPFSVESLSPHRVLSIAEDSVSGTVSEQEGQQQQDFAVMILENLKKAGVQNTRKAERLTFDRLDPYAGAWLNAAGEYTGADGKTRRVAVSIGPEHGTVGPDQVKEAAKEAVQGIGFDVLVVCGFAFDPHVGEEAKRYGKLTVLPTKMNPDLAMGNELLKKTGAGNLFMVFGEPDVEITRRADDQIVVEIKGVDVYDPTTGQIRSASTDDIACWFIDTDYNGESFFVRHAYFTGADEPYEKLKRALRVEIDEGAWSSLYSTVSRTFERPKLGEIAVKVINHYGDEVLKVFAV